MCIQKPTDQSIVSADDFLPMFTFVLVQASLPQLLLVKEIMTALVDDEETFGECGMYIYQSVNICMYIYTRV